MIRRLSRPSSMRNLVSAAVAAAVLCPLALSTPSRAAPPAQPATEAKASADASAPAAGEEIDYRKITAAQWKKRLTPQQFLVTRKHGTERAYSSKLHNSKADGVYQCVCCGQVLFDSQHKFDSGTGWPSFFQPIEQKAVGTAVDRKLLYPRTEVHCDRCGAHLGHVFRDAPQTPTGLRYCMNGVALEFVDREKWEKQQAASDERREEAEAGQGGPTTLAEDPSRQGLADQAAAEGLSRER